jgi:UDP-N-acetyl-2-amino-2-deoxyglucuronate dehydrogenase
LQAGKHVVCESPLCLTTAAVWQISETEKFCRRRLFTINRTRFHPFFTEVAQKLSGAEAGNVTGFSIHALTSDQTLDVTGWKGKKFPGGGLLYSRFAWISEALASVFGPVTEARGFISNQAHPEMETEDSGAFSVRAGNAAGTIYWSVNASKGQESTSISVLTSQGLMQGSSGQELDQPNVVSRIYEQSYDAFLAMLESNEGTGARESLDIVSSIEKIYLSLSTNKNEH